MMNIYLFELSDVFANQVYLPYSSGVVWSYLKNNPTIHYRLGSLEKLPKKGYFWATDVKFNLNELKRVFNFVIKTKENIWKIKSKPTANKMLKFDYDNKLFRSIVSKELKKKNN